MRPDLWDTTPRDPTTITTFVVPGMTGAQSAEAVTLGLATLPGVQRVSIDLDAKRVTVRSTHPLEWTTLVAVIAEVGYDISEFSSAT